MTPNKRTSKVHVRLESQSHFWSPNQTPWKFENGLASSFPFTSAMIVSQSEIHGSQTVSPFWKVPSKNQQEVPHSSLIRFRAAHYIGLTIPLPELGTSLFSLSFLNGLLMYMKECGSFARKGDHLLQHFESFQRCIDP